MANISINELCNQLDIGRNKAYKLLNSGEIEAFRIGRDWKIPQESIQKYIESNLKQSNIITNNQHHDKINHEVIKMNNQKLNQYPDNVSQIHCPKCGMTTLERTVEIWGPGKYSIVKCNSCNLLVTATLIKDEPPQDIVLTREFVECCTVDQMKAFCKVKGNPDMLTEEERKLLIQIWHEQGALNESQFEFPCVTFNYKGEGPNISYPISIERLMRK